MFFLQKDNLAHTFAELCAFSILSEQFFRFSHFEALKRVLYVLVICFPLVFLQKSYLVAEISKIVSVIIKNFPYLCIGFQKYRNSHEALIRYHSWFSPHGAGFYRLQQAAAHAA